MHGLIIDRKENGAPGEFAALGTEAEVMDAVRRELGDAAANALLVSLADTPEPEPNPTESVGFAERVGERRARFCRFLVVKCLTGPSLARLQSKRVNSKSEGEPKWCSLTISQVKTG